MLDNPKWFIFFFLTAMGLTVFCAFGDGLIAGPDASVWHELMHGDTGARLTATGQLFSVNYDWLTPWVAWLIRLVNIIFLTLAGWQIASMVRGR